MAVDFDGVLNRSRVGRQPVEQRKGLGLQRDTCGVEQKVALKPQQDAALGDLDRAFGFESGFLQNLLDAVLDPLLAVLTVAL